MQRKIEAGTFFSSFLQKEKKELEREGNTPMVYGQGRISFNVSA
jgi:hypothetical protein